MEFKKWSIACSVSPNLGKVHVHVNRTQLHLCNIKYIHTYTCICTCKMLPSGNSNIHVTCIKISTESVTQSPITCYQFKYGG